MKRAATLLVILICLSGCGEKPEVSGHFDRAIAFTRSGRIDEGIGELEEVITLDPEHARAHLSLGVLYLCKGLSEKALSALNNGVALLPDYEPVTDKTLNSMLQRYKLTPQEISERSYNMADIAYIWRCLKYKEACAHIIRERKSEREKLLALFDWTYRNVAIAIPKEDYAALPLDIMLRGYGYCDRSAWVFATLADQAGYRAGIFYLRDPDTLVSPHTVAIIFLEEKWVVFDTYSGIHFKKQDGEFTGLNDVMSEPSITHHIPRYKEYWSKCFEKGYVWIPVEAEGGLPKMQLIEEILNEFSLQPPKVYHNPAEELAFSIGSLQGAVPSTLSVNLPFKIKNYLVDIWFYPFNLRFYYMTGEFNENVERCNPQLEYYRSARADFVSGDYQKAFKEYDRLLKNPPDRNHSDDLLYFKSLALFELKDWEKTCQELRRYLEEYPEGRWKAGAIYHLGRSYEELKLYGQAIDEYSKIEEIPNVSERLKVLLSLK